MKPSRLPLAGLFEVATLSVACSGADSREAAPDAPEEPADPTAPSRGSTRR